MSGSAVPPSDRSVRIQRLARRLLATEAKLRSLTDGELDAIIDPDSSTPLLLRDAQHALRKAESWARSLIARLPIIACELEIDGTTRFVNEAVTTILGYSPDDIVGQEWWSALGVCDQEQHLRALLDGSASEHEGTVRTRDGELREMLWTAVRSPGPGTAPPAVLLFGVDLTERHRAENAARQLIREQAARTEAQEAERRAALLSEAGRLLGATLRYEATLTSMARLTVKGLAEYCIIDVVEDDGAMRRIDVAHPDIDGRDPMRERLAGEEPAAGALRVIPEVIRKGGAAIVHCITQADEDPFVAPDLSPSMAGRCMICAPLAARGNVVGAMTLISAAGAEPFEPSDVALVEELARRAALAVDNARLYEEALRASATKTEFLAVMSHELRTPLNAIMGYSDLLLLGIPVPTPPASQKQVQRIRLAATHLLQMIDEILTHSRIEAGEETLDIGVTEVCALLRETVEMVEPLAETKLLRLECETPDYEVPAMLDARKVRQIVLNLLGNAVKFTHSGTIRLHVAAEGEHITITVQDTGIGIAPHNLERIFEPFWQVEQGRARCNEGTGLGLNVALRLARLMDGDIHVSSREGEGTRFVLLLPWVRPPALAA
jgi:PAS domain S-box-containing protein